MNRLIPFSLFAILLSLSACNSDNATQVSNTEESVTSLINALRFPETPTVGQKGQLRNPEITSIYNAEAVIQPQCYTKHDNTYNPCMTCHQSYSYRSRPNFMNDGDLQKEYAFSDLGTTNHWQNLFEDRTTRIAKMSDQEVIDYINTDNYSPLIEQLQASKDWEGAIPAINNYALGAEAFDAEGIAKDGSHWVAFNYKPLPSTFWPTNGSTDDVLIRLPEAFRQSACGGNVYSRDTYLANLSIVEASIKDLSTISVPAIDENVFCRDLNGDNQFGVINKINVPSTYVGSAENINVERMLYPVGTQFLHSVRYVGLNNEGEIGISARMKELRYMKKFAFFDENALVSKYINENQEKIDELLPVFTHRGDKGTDNSFGWMVQGFIEAKDGHLRLQTREEHLQCMGCHTTLGTTIDNTFAFGRKVTGAKGWGYINIGLTHCRKV